MSFGEERFSLHRLSLTHTYSVILSGDLLHSVSSNSVENVADTHKISFMPLSEVYLSLHRKCTYKVVPIHAMQAYRGREETVSPSLILGTRWRRVNGLMLRLLYPQ
jgi:hypothetical protein